METVLNPSKKQTDKVVNYQGGNNAYINALDLLKEKGLEQFMDKIPYPMSQNIINITPPSENLQTKETNSESPVSAIPAKSGLSTLAKTGLIAAAMIGTGGLGAAIPIGLSLLDQKSTNTTIVSPEGNKLNPNLSFEVK